MDEGAVKSDTHAKQNWVGAANTEIITVELEGVINIDEIKSDIGFWKNIRSDQAIYGPKHDYFRRICGLCLCYPKEHKKLLKFRKAGLSRMKVFLLSSTRKEIQSKDIKLFMWCCLNLLAFFFSKQQDKECTCFQKKKLEQCKSMYISALYLVIPEKQQEVIKHTTRFLTITSLWNTDEYDLFVLQEILSIITKPELLIAKILKQLETSQKQEAILEAFDISCTLSSILEHVHWDKYLFNHLLHNCFNTLLKLFLVCAGPTPSFMKIENVKLRMVIKTCIRCFITNIKDNKGVLDEKHYCILITVQINQTRRLEKFRFIWFLFAYPLKRYINNAQTSVKSLKQNLNKTERHQKGLNPLTELECIFATLNRGLVNVMDSIAKCLHDRTIVTEDRCEIMDSLVYCAQKHQTKYYRESITPDCLELLLITFQSTDKSLTMASHKVMRYLLDRHGNEKNFIEPVYFFKGRSYFAINYDFSVEDSHFFRSFSQKFLEGIHYSFLTFTEKYCLTSCYLILCIVLVEIPEPVITINIIHILITIQNDVLKCQDFPLTVRAQIHAIICALVSLICVIHENEVTPLKKYTEEVVRFRTENSPHLLPPLQNKYVVSSHHTDKYHAQLYFLEEEVLYALQRCWLGKRPGASYITKGTPTGN